MQINVTSVHTLIPTINHYRFAHQFLTIIRSYRQGSNITFNTVSLPSIHDCVPPDFRPAALTSPTLLQSLFGVRSGGAE